MSTFVYCVGRQKMAPLQTFDLCIVGAGMIGSAAARHATRTRDLQVCLIGPSEPKVRRSDVPRDIYGSYYDEGRITRCTDRDFVWAKLAMESIKRYRDIERISGIQFYHERGNLMIGPKDSSFVNEVSGVIAESGVEVERCDTKTLRQKFPYLNLNDDMCGIKEFKNAGYINPRKLVEAQQTIARKQGCTIFNDVVNRVSRTVQSDGLYHMRVEMASGQVLHSKKVLLATGAFTESRNLLPGIQPDQVIKPLSTTLLEVDNKTRELLQDMPCAIYYGPASPTWTVPKSHQDWPEISFYMLPPIQYPNGRYYIKLGLRDSVPGHLTSVAEIKRWYDNGDPVIHENVAKFTASLFKDIHFHSCWGDSAVIAETPTTHPYIDLVHDQLGVAICGNGYAAKSSDEIGRLGVSVMLGRWESDIPKDTFTLKLRDRLLENCVNTSKAKL